MKKKIFVSFIVIVLIFGLTIVNATDDKPVTISEQFSESQKTMVNENIFDFSKEINESKKVVNGNEFLCSNLITIEDETINGDLFLCGNNVRIKENVTINGNVFICASNVEIQGKIERDVYDVSQYLSIGENAQIGYSLFAGAEVIKINGIINRDVNISGNDIEVTENAGIIGNLNYSSTKEGKISKDVVKGSINFSKQVEDTKTTGEVISDYVISLLRNVIFTLFIFLFVLLVSPRFIRNSKEYISSKILKSIGIGLAFIILIPISIIILIAVSGTMNFGLLLIPVYIVMFAISIAILTIAISSKLCEKFKKIKIPIMVPIVTAILWLIKQIPYINSVLIFFMLLAGFGIIIQNIFKKKE